MSFEKGFKRKASSNAQKRKGGQSYAIWKAANDAAVHTNEDVPPADQVTNDVALGTSAGINMPPVAQAADAIDEVSNTVLEDKTGAQIDEHSTLAKKRRNDDNWRVKRAVVAMSKKLAKEKETSRKLKKQNTHLQRKALSAEANANLAGHNLYKNAKAHREMSIEQEDNHKIAMQQLQDCHEKDLEEAYAAADAETARSFALEEERLRTEQSWKLKVREERQLHSANMAKAQTAYKAEQTSIQAECKAEQTSTKAEHSFELSKAKKEFQKELKKQNKSHAVELKKTHKQLSNAKANLEKEKRGHNAVMQHCEMKWNAALKSNLAKASDTHEKNKLILKTQLDKKDAVLMEDREKNLQR